jgi:hypothetical protein
MTAEDFVRRLRTAAPGAEQLRNVGFSAQEAAEFQRSFVCVLRSTAPTERQTDPLLDLLSRYELSTIEIGMITFASPAAEPALVRVGAVEADPLILDRRTGEVLVTEGSPSGGVLWRCARDGARFLDALAPAAEFLARCAFDLTLSDDASARRSRAEECSVAAGGAEYLDFYRMLLGAG